MNKEEKFIQLANLYNQVIELMSAICVQKGGIPEENYVGRFFVADMLEFLAEYGERLNSNNSQISNLAQRFRAEFDRVRDLTTPSQKPIHEMTLEEFEKIMNI